LTASVLRKQRPVREFKNDNVSVWEFSQVSASTKIKKANYLNLIAFYGSNIVSQDACRIFC